MNMKIYEKHYTMEKKKQIRMKITKKLMCENL